jgi:phage terminase small subunit
MMTEPRAPAHLSPAARRLWRQVVAEYELGRGEVEILGLALVALDRAAAARRILDEEGIVVAGLHGPRVHPCVAIERSSSLTYGRLLRQLGLDGAVAAGTAVRPEVLYGA